MKGLILPAVILAALTFPLCVQAQGLTPVLGSQVDLHLRTGQSLKGELLAARADTLWVLGESGLVYFPRSVVSRVGIPYTGGITTSKVLVWGLVAGVGSGLALTAACTTVDDASCGAVLPVTLSLWALLTGISAAATGGGPAAEFGPHELGELAAYARFPQGIPAAYTRSHEPPQPR